MSRLVYSALRALGRFNDRHPWSHNDAYARWILRQARQVRHAGGTRALDVGCGTGNLLARLAPLFESVTGIEPDQPTAARARQHLRNVANAEVCTFAFADVGEKKYDLITLVAVLHHLPLQETLRRVRALLRPGGRVVIVGVARDEPEDWPWSILSLVLNPLVGLAVHPRPALATPSHMTAPVSEPDETFAEIARVLRTELPGARIRRGLFWRYTATWRHPGSTS